MGTFAAVSSKQIFRTMVSPFCKMTDDGQAINKNAMHAQKSRRYKSRRYIDPMLCTKYT